MCQYVTVSSTGDDINWQQRSAISRCQYCVFYRHTVCKELRLDVHLGEFDEEQSNEKVFSL